MDWRYGAAFLASVILASLADWVFAGVLFHNRYQAHPEVWRFTGANPKALAAAQALTIPTVVGMIGLIVWGHHTALIESLTLASLVWIIAAAPAIIANGIYIKLHPLIVASHTIGWLVKLGLVAGATALILS